MRRGVRIRNFEIPPGEVTVRNNGHASRNCTIVASGQSSQIRDKHSFHCYSLRKADAGSIEHFGIELVLDLGRAVNADGK